MFRFVYGEDSNPKDGSEGKYFLPCRKLFKTEGFERVTEQSEGTTGSNPIARATIISLPKNCRDGGDKT
ncbi:hypothetical protein IID24_01370 [Patescibacteria group bacterium]|nr:hypothetical protein [Patescibacteria group bacterium]